MKSATRHVLLLAGMLCLWAGAYSLGRSSPSEPTLPRDRALPAGEVGVLTEPGGHAPDAPGTGIAARTVGADLVMRVHAPGLGTGVGGRMRGHAAPASSPRPRPGPG